MAASSFVRPFNDTCEICDEFRGGDRNSFRALFPPVKLRSRNLAQNENLLALAGLGALVPGYVLVFSKSHINNMGQMPIEQLDKAEGFFSFLKEKIHQAFNIPVVIFEHGDNNECGLNGSCIDHAHMHLCPTTVDFTPTLDGLNKTEISKLTDLHEWRDAPKGYCFYESLSGKRFVFETNQKLESQFLRKLWAASWGKQDEWDWAVFPNVDNILKTINTFSDLSRLSNG